MNSPSEPRLNKLPFFITDLVCLLGVLLIGLYAKDPFAPLPFVSAVVLIIIGGIALLVPYVTDYAADSAEASRRLHDELELQIKRAQAAGEGLARAAAQIKTIEEAVHKSARDAETLPYRMQEKLAEFNEALAAKESEDREALEQELEELRAANSDQLKVVADKIGKAAADWTALEVATRKQLAAAEAAIAKLHAGSGDAAAKVDAAATKIDSALAAALTQLEARVAALTQALATTPAPVARTENPAPAAPTAPSEPVPAESAPAEAAAPSPAPEAPHAEEAPKPKKPRAPRKPKAEDTLAAMSAEPAPAAETSPAPTAEPAPEPILAATDEASSESAPVAEASASSDGATRLLATAYIGIGNKLFIRGDGPGLSWDHGTPMQFVSIGKWGWSTQEASGPVRVKLYKNDEQAALSGEILLEPARHTEITALF